MVTQIGYFFRIFMEFLWLLWRHFELISLHLKLSTFPPHIQMKCYRMYIIIFRPNTRAKTRGEIGTQTEKIAGKRKARPTITVSFELGLDFFLLMLLEMRLRKFLEYPIHILNPGTMLTI